MSSVFKDRISPDAAELMVVVRHVRNGVIAERWRFDLDTGSPVTILGARAARDAGILDAPTKPRSRLWSIGGTDRGFRDVLPEIRTMNATLRNVEVVVHELPSEIDGVIGLDILRRGRLVVDLPWGLLEFAWQRAA